jgi:hypothetical protein
MESETETERVRERGRKVGKKDVLNESNLMKRERNTERDRERKGGFVQ